MFSPWDLRAGRDISGRDQSRKALSMLDHGVLIRLGDILPGRAPCAEADRADLLVDRLEHRTLAAMQAAADLSAARLDESPWSDDHWALYHPGSSASATPTRTSPARTTGRRTTTISSATRRATSSPARRRAIDLLSPAEKYDILVGDTAMGLTQRMWGRGQILSRS
ncbi:hypothetical protein [Nannocystis sp.]|uniref:hypothetical protein n=1 Tax=Nannocystis sp. TaxID=1962667 RepID=UPI0025E63164|nr:hypothetical protein [Nannocystis sp.]MBK7828621.1 hypothetical protein [Nannocystis sp.]